MARKSKILLILAVFSALTAMSLSFECQSAFEPTHNLTLADLQESDEYWNNWNINILKDKVREVSQVCYTWHEYIEGEFDCNDMAIDIWNMLYKEDIKSVIVCGDIENENETFADCNHAWLVILNKPVHIFALEPTTAKTHPHDGTHPQYFEGFFYKQPSDLRADLKERW